MKKSIVMRSLVGVVQTPAGPVVPVLTQSVRKVVDDFNVGQRAYLPSSSSGHCVELDSRLRISEPYVKEKKNQRMKVNPFLDLVPLAANRH